MGGQTQAFGPVGRTMSDTEVMPQLNAKQPGLLFSKGSAVATLSSAIGQQMSM